MVSLEKNDRVMLARQLPLKSVALIWPVAAVLA